MSPNWFIALRVPAPDLRERLGAPPPGVRLIHPDDLHLTLAFLGDVDETRARAAWAERHRLAPLGPSQRLGFGAVVGLGNPRRPSALSARLAEGDAEFRAAIARARDAMNDASGSPREQRPPLPHVTLARVRRSAGPREHEAALAWARALDLGGLGALVERVALYTASSGRGERQYREVEEDALPGAVGPGP
ncbi:MAG TPA: 2'-5' RNA ligase family protein [Polyangiaceae bacterium]|nr:2'-5' RNA ligase family protein [Polyangiaceae bacterium]